jgi:hypothetical protein
LERLWKSAFRFESREIEVVPPRARHSG